LVKIISASHLRFLLFGCALLFAACTSTPQPQNTNQPATPSTPSAPAQTNSNQQAPSAPKTKPQTAVIETNMGKIKFELLADDAPKTVENFRALAEKGYYNNLTFHRVIKNFMIQGGDPMGNGTGGATANGKPLPNEINRNAPLYKQGGYLRGMVAMANKGIPESANSQFFIMHQSQPYSTLPPNYVIFGKVTEGMEVVDKIASVPTGPADKPTSPVVMRKVYIEK